MALSDHTLIAAYPLGSGIADLQDSYDGYSAQNMTFAGDGDLSGLPVADFNSSYYGIDNTLQNGFDTEYSFSMWLKPETIGGGQKVLMMNEQHGSYYGTFGVYLTDDGQLYLFVRNANGGAYDIAYTGASLVVDEWSHVVATWSGTEIKWYVDGALESTTSASRVPWNSPATLWIGANATKANKQYFDGKMSDLRFWYSELTASDVAELHAAGQVPIDLGMVAKYALDTDGSDSIGSNDGTATGVTFESAGGRSYASFALGDEITTGPTAFLDSMLAGSTNKTLSAWVKIDSYTAGSSQLSVNAPTIMSKGDLAAGYIYFNMGINSGYPSFYWYDGSSGREFKSTTRIDLNTWVHVSLVIDDSNTMTYYINGVATGDNGQVFNGVAFAGGQRISLGAGVTHSGHQSMRFAGDMDDLRVWSRALGDSEIATLHSSTQVLEDGLVAKYALDTDAVDSIGSNDGSATGVSFDNGYATFERDNSPSITAPASLASAITGDYTISAWMRFETISGYYSVLTANQEGLALIHGKPGFLSGGDVLTYDNSLSALSVDTWYHIVMTKSDGNKALYVDGTLLANGSDTSTAWAFGASVQIGRGSFLDGAAGYLDGDMNDLRVWSRALGASEVTTLHTAGAEPYVPPALTDDLVAKYALDTDGSDSVGSNDGTNANVTFADGAAQFNGSNARFTLASEPFTASDADYTISVWAKHNNISSTQRLLGWGGLGARYFVGYLPAIDKIYIGMGGIDIVPTVSYKPVAGQVEHWVFSNSGNTTKFYKDGVLVDTVVHGATGAISAGVGMRIGAQYMEYGEYLDGSMDDLRIWDRQLSDAEVTTLHAAAAAAAPSGGAAALIDITYGGQLSGVRAFDHNGSVFCYITEESEAPSVYFGTDLSDFASFEKKTIINELSQPMALDGKPISMSMKSDDGSIYLGTSSGKLYHVAYDAGTNCVAKELHDAAEGVRKVHWDSHRSECLFESDGVIHSVDLSETVSVKHALAAGSMVEDFKAAPAGVAIVFRKADFTFEVMFVEGTNWASPKASSQMIESVRAARDFEYNSDLDMWVAAGSTGQISVATLF